MTQVRVEMSDEASAEALGAEVDHLGAHEVQADADRFELKIELDAVYDSHAEHGRALASLLLAIHRWLDEQDAQSVDVMLDGRKFTIHAPGE